MENNIYNNLNTLLASTVNFYNLIYLRTFNSSLYNDLAISEALLLPVGTKVSVQGFITLTDDREVILQDHTGGIALIQKEHDDNFVEGDFIKVNGVLTGYCGGIKIRNYFSRKLPPNLARPEPLHLSMQDIKEKPSETFLYKLLYLKKVRLDHVNTKGMSVICDCFGNRMAAYRIPDNAADYKSMEVNLTAILTAYNGFCLYVMHIEKASLPELDCLKPANMSSISSRIPEISAVINALGAKIDWSSAVIYLDGDKIKPNVSGAKIYYAPKDEMELGEHSVKVSVKDSTGNISEKSWYFNIINKDAKYNFYFGIPHTHTCYSDGKGRPFEACEHARNKGLNFLFAADHSNFLDGVKKGNYEYDKKTNQYIEVSGSEWHKTRVESEFINNKFKDFIAIRGFEMSTTLGHINVLNSNCYVEGKKQLKSINEFYNWLFKQKDIIVAINHPGNSFKKIAYNPDLDRIINLIEVGNGASPRIYKRFEKIYFDMLDSGWHLGAINGQDNHSNNWGDSDNLTVILSESITKNAFLEAMKNRRTYSTESRTLKLLFRCQGCMMGSIINTGLGDTVKFEITAEDKDCPIEKLQIISNGGVILCEKAFDCTQSAFWTPEVKTVRRESWHVVKVIHSNQKWGISSPIFISAV